jgi:crotonobetaine/carnitine-CoA ligase
MSKATQSGTDSDNGHTVVGLLWNAVNQAPDAACMQFGRETITYAQMWERSVSVARGLSERGVCPGETVALHLGNCPEFLYSYFGASILGAVTAPINLHHRGLFLEHQLNLVEAAAVVADPIRLDRIAAVASAVPSIRTMFTTDGEATSGTDLGSFPLVSMEELLSYEANPTFDHTPKWTDRNLILFTSGTTGPSKAAVVSNNYIVTASIKSAQQKSATAEDIFWSPLPLFHGNAIMQTVLGPISLGATGALEDRFSVSKFWSRVREIGATQVSILGAQFVLLWNRQPEADDADNPIRVMFGAPLPAEIHPAFEDRFNVRYVTAYGLGEAHPLLVSSYDDPPPPGCAGKEWAGFEVRVVDDDDRPVADGEVGEIVCRPRRPSVMFDGYLKDDLATLQVTRNLWFHSGDFGRRRHDGWFEFVDRKKDYMRRRGENVSSWEVEQAVLAHPLIAEAAAFSVPSELTEDEIMLVVVLEDGAALTYEQIVDHCSTNMPYFAVPRYVEVSPVQLANDLGKIPKHELKARGITGATWDREVAGYTVDR